MDNAVADEYKSSLADLNCNSKPLINMLTILAEENIKYSPQIVKTITDHVIKVSPDAKLPCMYLIDSIIKNVRKQYLNLFSQNIVTIFASVFEKVDEITRMLLYKLRQTWNEIFPNKILYALDMRVKGVDPAWPVTSQPPPQSIHINPKFLGAAAVQQTPVQPPILVQKEEDKLKAQQTEVLKQLLAKQEQLRLLEEKRKEITTKKLLSSDSVKSAAVSAVPNAQSRVDPRVVAKMNPKLIQRDPRLQKAVIASVIKKNLTQAKLGMVDNKEVAQSLPTLPNSRPTLAPPVPAIGCDKSISRTTAHSKNLQKNDRDSPKISEHLNDNKNSETVNSDGKNERKSRLEKDSLTKRELSSSPSSRNASGRKKRKTDESRKEETEISPKKSPKGKGNKKKDSPKKSSAISQDLADGKIQQRSRSPLHKGEKKSVNRESNALKEKKSENESVDSKHKQHLDKRGKKQEVKDDTDLRKMSKDQESRNKRVAEEGVKENFDEPPEKKYKDMTRKDSETDSLFGREDQDYRQLSKNGKLSHHKGWAMYKAAHPDEFRIPKRQFSQGSDMENQQPGYREQQKNDNGEKLAPPQFREYFDNGPVEYDRLGRIRLSTVLRNSRFGYMPNFLQRDATAFRSPFADKQFQDLFLTSVMGDPKDVMRQAEEQCRLGRISEADLECIRRGIERMRSSEMYRRFRSFQELSRQPNFGGVKEMHHLSHVDNKNYMNVHPSIKEEPHMMSQTAVRTFRLDNKSRTIHFIDDKAIVLLDNGEPRELTFRGDPTQVFIQGLEPITLRFDGNPVEFELDGKLYSMKFGTPSRELYINSHPYEGKFGGPPFDVVLNGRVHKVNLGSPPPQVQVSDYSANELYRKFLAKNRGNPEVAALSSKEILRDHSNTVPFDVDMRSEPGQVNRNSEMRDIDWRQGPLVPTDGRDNARGYDFDQNGPHVFPEDKSQQMNFRDQAQDGEEWDHREDPNFRPFPRDQIPPRQPDWRKYPPPPLRDIKREYSPHHTPPPESHTDEWEQKPVIRPYDQGDQNAYNNRPWMPRNFSHDGPRPPGQPPVSETGNVYNTVPRNTQYESFPEYHEGEPRGPAKYPIRPPMRPPFHHRPNRPDFGERPPLIGRLPRPPLPPWITNPRMPPPDNLRLPILPPPPRPPMHMRMPESFMRALPPPPISMPSVIEPAVSLPSTSVAAVSSTTTTVPSLAQTSVEVPGETAANPVAVPASINPTVLNLDVSALFEKLISAGIISKPKPDPAAEKTVTEEENEVVEGKEVIVKKEKEKDLNEEPIPPIQLKLQSLKLRYSGVTSALYRGSQCASCGMRFKEIHGERYSRHLDWHFRVNRREKDGVKKAFSRKWFYEVEDWIQFEEFEDFEERARSFFELQADEQFQVEAEVEVPSVPVSGQESEACVVCGELFQLFWVEEEEEWHLRNAVRHDGQAYHPSCYEDFKKSIEAPVKEEPVVGEVKEEVTEMDVPEEPAIKIKEEPLIEDEEVEKEFNDAIADVVKMLAETTVTEDERRIKEEQQREEEMQLVVVKEEPKEEEEEEEEEVELQGKPGEEEIIGVIADADIEKECVPTDDSEKVIFESGGIIMKVRAESLKPASPCPENVVSKETISKEAAEESEEEEFRPPTPDPRFQVLPPVQRGTELSGLCTIM